MTEAFPFRIFDREGSTMASTWMGTKMTDTDLVTAGRRIRELEEAITDAMKAVGRQVVCGGACDDPYCILARALGRNLPLAPWWDRD